MAAPRIRFLRQWHGYAPGKTSTDVGRGVAELLAQRGIVRFDDEPSRPDDPSNATPRRTKRTKK